MTDIVSSETRFRKLIPPVLPEAAAAEASLPLDAFFGHRPRPARRVIGRSFWSVQVGVYPVAEDVREWDGPAVLHRPTLCGSSKLKEHGNVRQDEECDDCDNWH